MELVAIALCAVLLILALVQAVMGIGFARAMWSPRRLVLADEKCPKTAVLLCLRGADPFLGNSIKALLRQDFPNYDVFIVVDSVTDPAWTVAETAIAEANVAHAHLEALTNRRETCHLKASSMLQVLERIVNTHEVVAFVDADALPPPTWLRELVAPLVEDGYAGSTGNRWFMPVRSNWGSLVRFWYNVPAVREMVFTGVPWGGTMALRVDAIRQCGLLELWSSCWPEDAVVFTALTKHKLRVAFVPSLMIANREWVGMGPLYTWMRRQLFMARIVLSWWMVLGKIFITALPVVALVLVGVFWAMGELQAAAWTSIGAAVYTLVMFLLMALGEASVRSVLRGRGENTRWITGTVALLFVPCFFLMHIAATVAFITAFWLRRIEWRGASYEVEGPWKVRLVEYKPYEQPKTLDPHASV